jgi:predicted amidohydrolase
LGEAVMMGGFRIAVAQTSPVLGERDRNLEEMCRLAVGVDADLLVFPELATTGYAITDRDLMMTLAEKPGGSSGLHRLQEVCEGEGMALVTGIPLREDDKLYNAATLLRPGMDPAFYRKLHLFYRERQLFSPGDRRPEVWEWGGVKLGMMICFDWVYPELARLLTLAGAEVIVHPANLVLTLCQQAMRTRAIENGVFTVTVNRVGQESFADNERLTFTGQSQVTSPRGELLLTMPAEETGLQVIAIDPLLSQDKKLTPLNDLLGDRRSDIYGDLLPDQGDHD